MPEEFVVCEHEEMNLQSIRDLARKLKEPKAKKTETDYICTMTGAHVYPLEPRRKDNIFYIEDIAHALAHCCRYNGHTPKFYSVAEHSVKASQYYRSHKFGAKIELMLLLHDASEAYLSDVPRPLKQSMPEYKRYEDELIYVIMEKFGVANEWNMHNSLHKTVDMQMLAIEKRDMFPQNEWTLKVPEIEHPEFKVEFWTPEQAKKEFLLRYAELMEKIKYNPSADEPRYIISPFIRAISEGVLYDRRDLRNPF